MVGPVQNNINDNYDEKDINNGKPPIFNGENLDYLKDRIRSFF